jgi:glycosyltransferase involved in cell wall biosynthesis
MLSTMRLSVALCTYNGARYLPDQLQSLASQRRLPDEVVVCDDGSTDDTVAVVRRFAAQAPFDVQLAVNPSNLGFVKNFEEAIRRCTGDLIALADQDDVWHPEKLEVGEQTLLAAPGADGVFSDAELVDDRLRPSGALLWETVGFTEELRERFRAGEAFRVLLRRQVVTGATLLFRARVRDFVLPIPGDALHDAWIALLLAAVSELRFVERPLMSYRQHTSNQIGARRWNLWKRLREAQGGQGTATVADYVSRYVALRARLQGMANNARMQDVLDALDEKIEHFSLRAHLPKQRIRRLPTVLRELASRRYAHYSNGLTSAAMDLLL